MMKQWLSLVVDAMPAAERIATIAFTVEYDMIKLSLLVLGVEPPSLESCKNIRFGGNFFALCLFRSGQEHLLTTPLDIRVFRLIVFLQRVRLQLLDLHHQ